MYTTAQASGRAVELSDSEARGPLRSALLESIKTVPVEAELRKPGRRNYFSPNPLSFRLFHSPRVGFLVGWSQSEVLDVSGVSVLGPGDRGKGRKLDPSECVSDLIWWKTHKLVLV